MVVSQSAVGRGRIKSWSFDSTFRTSPTIGTSTCTFLLIADGSISMWIFFASAANASGLACHPVVEPRTHGDQHVAVIHRHVRIPGSVHAEHAERKRIRFGERPESMQGRGHRAAERSGKCPQLFRGTGLDGASTDIQHRPLRSVDQVRSLPDLAAMSFHGGVVRGQIPPAQDNRKTAFCAITSLGRSTSTGPGRPLVAM